MMTMLLHQLEGHDEALKDKRVVNSNTKRRNMRKKIWRRTTEPLRQSGGAVGDQRRSAD